MEQFGLDKETPALLAQEREELPKELQPVWHFVNDVEGKDEVDRSRNVQARLVAFHQPNTRREIRSFKLAGEFVEHSLLEIDCDDFAFGTNQSSQFDGKEPWTAAHIQSGHSFAHKR
jgi:hypothetical protein